MHQVSKTKVLFIVNGLGLGNSTRCSAIIHELYGLGYEIDLVTSANGLNYFKTSDKIAELFSFRSLVYGKHNGKLSVVKTILMFPWLFGFFILNCITLRSILSKNKYSAVIFDSDYSVISIKWQRQRPLLLAINNAEVIVSECRKRSDLPRNIRMQYVIEKLDSWFHKRIPDFVICPVFDNVNLADQPKIKYTPPIIRQGLAIKTKKQTVNNILIMLSGSQFGSDICFLNKLPQLKNIKISIIGKNGTSNNQFSFYGKVYNNQNFINDADILVINAGFSAISEAIVLEKPVIVIPVENHAEQFINSHRAEQSGFGLIATQENADEKIMEMLGNFEKYRAARGSSRDEANGAEIAAAFISKTIESKKVSI